MPAWDKATKEELDAYTDGLHQRLQQVKFPGSMIHCHDPMCKDTSHSKERDSVVLDILLVLVDCSYTTLPLTGQTGGGNGCPREIVPGWSAEVEPHRLQSNVCYRAWLSAGKPRQGEAHAAKLNSHAQFRHAVRRVKRAAKLHQAQGLFGAAMAGDLELMREMRRVKTGKAKLDEKAEMVDEVTGETEVANKFAEIFSALYNSSESKEGMEELHDRIRTLLRTENNRAEVNMITGEVVKTAATRMKAHKMDVSQGFSSEALQHAPDLLFQLLALVFQDWLIHGTVTDSVLACAFIPLVKGSKNPSLSGSYRAIAGSSLILKLFERCILMIWGDRLHSDSLQFGFKKKYSTGQATWLEQEVLQHT